MIGHAWTVVCLNSITDSDTNNVTLVNVIEQLTVPAAPPRGEHVGIGLKLDIVSLWYRDPLEEPQEGEFRIDLQGPSETTLHTDGPRALDMTESRRIRTRVQLSSIPFEGAGVYKFVTSRRLGSDWEPVASVPVEIVVRKS